MRSLHERVERVSGVRHFLFYAYHLEDGELLFAMEILTQPDVKRIAVKAPVESLHRFLTELESKWVKMQGIYDC
jgi:hypothetical protein